MIVGKQKAVQEVYEMIKDSKKVLVLGCNTCVAVCHAGGDKEAEILAYLLRITAKQKKQDMEIRHISIERQCENDYLSKIQKELTWSEAVVSTACGAGVQFVAERYPHLPVFPGIDTCFMGVTDKMGLWTERCQACGNCILDKTAGICPIARCPKRLLNGPCGGARQGKCEINPDQDCVWQLIINRMKQLGQMDLYEQLAPLKDWSTERSGGPRQVRKEE